jgi:tetratricopeptide (TPR) repeat protein/nucleoside phosphorylase
MRAAEAPSPTPYRAVILTALAVEYMAVRAHLTGLREEAHPEGTLYERGQFRSESSTWEVLLVEVGAGNPRAAFETERALQYFNPHVALFVGIAGGLKDVELGDVVVAPKVYGYESGKVRQEFEPRPDVGESSYALEQRARLEARREGWLLRLPGPEPVRKPRAHLGAIAAGEKVVAETRSALCQFLRTRYGDALAVEMEGRGFLTAVRANPRVDALVIRGISDLIGGKAEVDAAGSQQLASRHASAFAFEVLARFKPPRELALQQTPAEEQPGVWTVPHPRNPNFTGRSADLEALRAHFLSDPARPRPLALSGLGGVGKTQLAVEYASRHALDARDYSHVLWLRAEEPSVLASGYAALTEVLGLPERAATEQAQKVAAVQRWLQQHDRWLLIFDNAEQPGELRSYLPPAPRGHVLITSRNPVWTQLATPHPVGVLERGDSIALLLKRSGTSDPDAAATLAQALGDLPLALTQAAAYIEATGKSLEDYLRLFEQRRLELLARPEEPAVDYPQTVAATWTLSFEQVRARSPEAAALLSLCAFLNSSPIPIELLTAGAELLPPPLSSAAADELRLDEAVAVLRRYSLVQLHERALIFHRLVQGVMRARLADERKSWSSAALRLIHRFFDFHPLDLSTWPRCELLLPHALAVAVHAAEAGTGLEVLPELLWLIGCFWKEQAAYELAEQILAWALALLARAPAASPLVEARVRQALATVMLSLGRLDEAREHLERSQWMVQALPRDDSQQFAIAVSLSDLAILHVKEENLPEARALAERALELGQRVLGTEHPRLGPLWSTKGVVLLQQEEPEQARVCLARALAYSEAEFSSPHPKIAQDLNNLAKALDALGEHEEARACFERALEMLESIYGPRHPDLASVLCNLGGVHQKLKNLPVAREYYERALDIQQDILGPDHRDVFVTLTHLASVLYDQGEYSASRARLERALASSERIRDLPLIAREAALESLAQIQAKQGALKEARASFEGALALLEKVFGSTHPRIATLLNELAVVLHDLGNSPLARSHLERALAIDEQAHGPVHAEVLIDLLNLATLLIDPEPPGLLPLEGAAAFQEESAAALQYVDRALALCEQLPDSHERLALALLLRGSILFQRGQLLEARAVWERALRQATPEPRREYVRMLHANLGTVLTQLKSFKLALHHLDKAKTLTARLLGMEHPRYADILATMGCCHVGLGKAWKALPRFQRALEILERQDGPEPPLARQLREWIGALILAQEKS